MMAARQAAAAQLEQFRAEMVAEAAKMRAAVERQVQTALMHHQVWLLPCVCVQFPKQMQKGYCMLNTCTNCCICWP